VLTLYSYFRSSAAYRVRIALNLKGLAYETVSIHLQKEGGLNRKPAYRAINPQMLAQLVACDIHPLNNTSPLRYLKNKLGQDQAKIDAWYHHWILEGFEALEAMIAGGRYAFGEAVTLADICLVPQVTNARRLKVPLERFPKIVAIDAACAKLPAFEKARP
jgi:glutathione S-transferase